MIRSVPSRGAALAMAAAALVACSQMPAYERPAAPVPGQWPAGSAQPGGLLPDADWRSFFSDDTLRELIGRALAGNRDLRVAVANIELARSQLQARRADAFPALNAAAAGNRQPTAAGAISSSYTLGLAVSAWELDFFGRIASLTEAARAQYLASEEGRKAAQMSLVAAVANGWLALCADEESLRLTRETLSTREASLKLVRMRFDAGVSGELDLRQAESLTEAARVALAQLQRQRALDENALAVLLGEPLPERARAAVASAAVGDKRWQVAVPEGLPSELLVRRPDVQQAEQLLVAANANIGAARAAFFPRISLSASAGIASSQLTRLIGSGSAAWSFNPQASLPLLDAGRNEGNLAAARASRDIAVAQYEKAIQVAFREVADALAGNATLAEQLRAQQAQADAEAARFRLAELRFSQGVASALDLLDAQRALFSARQAVIQARLLQAQNQVQLYKALGGGWKAPEPKA